MLTPPLTTTPPRLTSPHLISPPPHLTPPRPTPPHPAPPRLTPPHPASPPTHLAPPRPAPPRPQAAAAGLAAGQRVAYSVLGTYCEYTAVPAAKVVQVPDGVGLEQAVACMTQGFTAHYLTNHAHAGLVKPGEWMLIHGVGGGTCQWAAQMAKLKGYKVAAAASTAGGCGAPFSDPSRPPLPPQVIGTCPKGKEGVDGATACDELIVTDTIAGAPCESHPSRVPTTRPRRVCDTSTARPLGTPYEDYSSVDIVGKVMEVTNGEGVKAVIDGIGASTAPHQAPLCPAAPPPPRRPAAAPPPPQVDISLDSLARRGIFVTFGNASGAVPAFPPIRLIKKSLPLRAGAHRRAAPARPLSDPAL